MRSRKSSRFLCHAFVSSIVVLITAFLGLGVRTFATADTARFIFVAAFAIVAVIFVLYFMLRQHTRELTAHSLFVEHPFVKRSLFPRSCTIGMNPPLTLDRLSERSSRAGLAVVKTAGESLTVSP